MQNFALFFARLSKKRLTSYPYHLIMLVGIPLTAPMVSVLGVCAQMERESIAFRLNSGRTKYIADGGKLGRKVGSVKSKERKQEEYGKVIRSLKAGKSIRDTAAICGVSVSTVQRVKKEFGI